MKVLFESKKSQKPKLKVLQKSGIVFSCKKDQNTDLQKFLDSRQLQQAHEADYKRQREGTSEALNSVSTGNFERF